MELAAVLTHHIGGIAGLYRLNEDSLDLVVQRDGVTSHPLGTRNQDIGLAGNGQPELVVFNQPFTEFMALRRIIDCIEKAWETPVDGKAATNLAAVDTVGRITISVGREDGVLRTWLTP